MHFFLSNFTVFVGNNNSGKTQLMELIYAVIKHVSALTPDMDLPQINDVDAFRMGKEEITDLNERVNKYLAEHIHEMIDETFNASVPIEDSSLQWGKKYPWKELQRQSLELRLKEGPSRDCPTGNPFHKQPPNPDTIAYASKILVTG